MVKVKICGITNQADYLASINFDTDFIGFVFYNKSKRFISSYEASRIRAISPTSHKRVGVFVNEDQKIIKKIFYESNLDIVQLHGDETPEYCEKLQLPYWKAVRIKDEKSLKIINEYNCDTVLIDAYDEKLYGGTGKNVNLKIIEKALNSNKKIIVAGGLSKNNIIDVIKLNPFAVDISSSIEIMPGKKDLVKMKELFEIIQDCKNSYETK